ncbi:ChaC-like protein [Entophlyctis helioformis]|nr:ChaC-like protein [Entophlyctis helioformis]
MAMWVFGYGSLIWKVDFPVKQQVVGYIEGFVRRFWQHSNDHRGTPEAPGRVVAVMEQAEWLRSFAAHDPHAAATRVWGVAYRVPDDKAEEVRRHLDHREKHGYDTRHVRVLGEDGSVLVEDALMYFSTPTNDAFVGPAPLADIARQIHASVGPSGPNKEYLYHLADALHALGKPDPHIQDLTALVRALDRPN